MSINAASTIVGRVSCIIWGCEGSKIVINKLLPAFIAKKANERSLSHFENEHPQSVNDFGSCIIGNIRVASSKVSINKDMAAFMGRSMRNIPTTSSGTVTTYIIYTATTEYL
jgi:hypothetical protein